MLADIIEEKINIFIFILYTIVSFFYNNLLFKIIDLFSPNHYAVSRVFEAFGLFIIDVIISGVYNIGDLVIKIVVFILLILSTFIYNEFLVINIYDLAKNTKLFLDYEESRENLSLNETKLNIELQLDVDGENEI